MSKNHDENLNVLKSGIIIQCKQKLYQFYQKFRKIDYKIWYICFIIILILVQVKFLSSYSSQLKEQRMKKVLFKMKYNENLWDDQSIQSKAYLAHTLFTNPNSQFLKLIEEYRMNRLYNTDEYKQKQQLPLCVSIVGISNEQSYSKMLLSIFRQKYSNYKIVFIDDGSSQKVVNLIKKFIDDQVEFKKKQGININVTSIFNTQRKYALQNRHQSIVKHCSENDIILDVDGDDQLIGSHIFKFINTIYQRSNQTWALYFNLMYHHRHVPLMSQHNIGPIAKEIFKNNSYRTSQTWKTTALKTFKRKLYMKIDTNDFLDSEGNYYKQKPDAFIHYAIVQLAGKQHIQKIDQPLYYYNYQPLLNQRNQLKLVKSLTSLAATLLTPYEPLNSLYDEPKRVKNYQIPDNIKHKYNNLFEQNPNLKNIIRVKP